MVAIVQLPEVFEWKLLHVELPATTNISCQFFKAVQSL